MTVSTSKPTLPGVTLETPIQFARGVGPVRAKLLEDMGIKTCGDLLRYYPRDYLKYAGGVQVSDLRAGEMVTLQGTLLQTRLIRKRPARFEALLDDGSGRCVLTWFNPHGLADKLSPGLNLRVTGKVTVFNGRPQIVQPRYQVLEEKEEGQTEARIEPVYAATADLPSPVIAKIVHQQLDDLVPQVHEWFAPEYLKERNLLTRQQATTVIHRPPELKDATRARRTLAYHEFFLHQTAVAIKRYFQRNGPAALALRTDEKVDARIRALLDFELTAAQNRVVDQIKKDLQQVKPMNRLLQGDVGSGKTVVALYAMLTAVATGAQAALMAPTEILAEQHFITLQRYLAHGRVKMALLVGQQSAAERAATLAGIEDGSIGLVVGTHAILSEGVRFKNLAMVVIDEQHKFGVSQRAAIRGKHGSPHTLVMTATPIPRTLAMTAFGDLDVSVIDELPPGRHPVFTKMAVDANREHVYQFVAGRLKEGEQAYVVLPIIDEGVLDLKSATSVRDELQAQWLKDYRVALIHGRMDRATRQHVMERFRQKLIDVLVATTVIEVGVDVPNATVMVIEHADRFGLSQLHQLRGRVGRSEKKSHCVLIGDSNTEDGIARLQAMVKYSSGFKIAEEDLKIRGMGEIIGTRQSGSSDMHFADLLFDTGLLMMARRDAFHTIAADPRLLAADHAEIRREVLGKFGDSISLADVG
jgi:ATP-dependent DNA helicase RecG